MARTDPQHNHRFDSVALKEMIAAAAAANGRSLTAEINARLKQSFESGNEAAIRQDASAVPALLALDSKVEALCRHLGVKADS